MIYEHVASVLDCEVAVIRAMAEVESNGDGFIVDGVPKILFEAHYFSRLTGGVYDISHPQISSRSWNRDLYKGGKDEYLRLFSASLLDRNAAYKSCSWGAFQIMGVHYSSCGYTNVVEFARAMSNSQDYQLLAFAHYIKHYGIDQYLREKNWEEVARRYNGPSYAENEYDKKMERAYIRFSSSSFEQEPEYIKEVQEALNVFGFGLIVDGVSGPKTREAISKFQRNKGLIVSGVMDLETLAALGLRT